MRAFPADGRWIRHLAYTPDGRCLVVDGQGLPDLVWWDWLAGTVWRRFRLADALPREAATALAETDPSLVSPRGVAFRNGTPLIATSWEWSGQEDCLHVYDVGRRREVGLRVAYRTRHVAFALAPDGSRVAARATYGGAAEMGCLELWRPDSTAPVVRVLDWVGGGIGWFEFGELEGDPNQPRPEQALAFDGRHVASVGEEPTTLRVWDSHASPPTGDTWELAEVDRPSCVDRPVGFVPLHLAFADNAPDLAVGGGGLGVYHLGTGRWQRLERDREMVHAVTLTDYGRHLLAGTAAGAVELWDVPAGRLVRHLTWDHGPVTAVAFAPDGQTCAAGTATGWVVVWDRDG